MLKVHEMNTVIGEELLGESGTVLRPAQCCYFPQKRKVDRTGFEVDRQPMRICPRQHFPAPSFERVRVSFRVDTRLIILPEERCGQHILASGSTNKISHDFFSMGVKIPSLFDPTAFCHLCQWKPAPLGTCERRRQLTARLL